MDETKKELTSVGAEMNSVAEPESSTNDNDNINQPAHFVKRGTRGEQLRGLRLFHDIPAADMVAKVQDLYPKYDKYMQSKAENSDMYGVEICADALRLLWKEYDPEGYEQYRRKKDGHKLQNRVQCCLDDETFKRLIAKSRADGFKTVNDCLVDLIKAYTANSDWDV